LLSGGRWRRLHGIRVLGGRRRQAIERDAHLFEHRLRGFRVHVHASELADARLLLAQSGHARRAARAADQVRVHLGTTLWGQLVVDEGAEGQQAAFHRAISL
jgi:hypothetical protein